MDELKQLLQELGVNKRLEITVWSLDDDELEFTFHSSIQDVDGNYFLVNPPPEGLDEINRHMNDGVVVGVVLDTYPNPMIFYPLIHSHVDNPLGYWLQVPANAQVEVVQRRRHVRIPMGLPIKVEYQLSANNWPSAEAVTEDVSGGGMRFQCVRGFPKDQELLIHLQFAEESRPPGKQPEEPSPMLKLSAKVVFSVESRDRKDPDLKYSTACQFVNLTEQQEMIIMRECFKRELRLKVKR